MQRISPTIYNRDFSTRLLLPRGQYVVSNYSHKAIGGPFAASIDVNASDAVWQLLDLLRCPVELRDDAQRLTWWGYVAAVVIRVGAHAFTVSLDDMGNKVTVAFGLVQHGGTSVRATTTPASNADSVTAYGIKELRVNMASGTTQQANALRDTVLAQRGLPVLNHRTTGAAGQGSYTATLECRGWYETLGWQNYAATNKAELNDVPTVNSSYGGSLTGQKFQLPVVGDAWNIDSIDVKIWNHGIDMVLQIQSDAAGVPSGTVLGTSDVLAHGMMADGRGGLYSTFTFSTPPHITGAVPYWVVYRTWNLALGGTPFDVQRNDFNPYPRGDSAFWSGSAWTVQTGGDYAFKIQGVMQSSDQVAAIIAATGQFLTGTDNELAGGVSGILSSPYRSGDLKADDEVLALLQSGTSNGLRMLASVGPDRRVRLFEEPLPSTVGFYQQLDGTLRDGLDQLVELATCPCAVWIDQRGIVPPNSDLPNLAPAFPYFIEESSYNALSGVWTPVPRGVRTVWNLAKVKA